tara:strand:+ start:110 stop:355 length:246 start_codon:yes stop_codon:yes gene_type:complete
MKIFFILSMIIIAILFFGKRFFYDAKRNLFKDQASWLGKDLKIKYSNSNEINDTKGDDNYLKMIADESQIYLDDQSKKEQE